MSPLRALFRKSARERAGDVVAELYSDGDKPDFHKELGDVVTAISNQKYLDLPKELGQAALAGQATVAKTTGTNLPLIGADEALEEKRRRRHVWRQAFAQHRLPFSEALLSGGSDFGSPDAVRAAFLAAGKEINDREALRIPVQMTQQFDGREKSAKVGKFSMPENPGIKDDNEKYRLSAGCNDWETANTWCWVDLGDYRGDVTRLWFKVNFPEGTTSEDDYDPKLTSSASHAAATKAGKEHGERAWKKWIETAKDGIRAYKKEHDVSGNRYSRYDWERGFRGALTHPDMQPYVADHGEMRSEFVEKEAAAPHIDKMRAILRRAGELSKAFGADSADRFTMEQLGSVYNVAKRRLRDQVRQAGSTPQAVTRDTPPNLPAAPQGPLRQMLLPFLDKGAMVKAAEFRPRLCWNCGKGTDPEDTEESAHGRCDCISKSSSAGGRLKAQLRRARNATHTHPTPGQASAGNYAKGEVTIHGMTVKLENPRGTERRGYDKDGNVTWRRIMVADYGYFKGTNAVDGDAVDCFIGPDPESNFVVAIDQKKSDGSFDETKFVLGCTTQEQAEKLYLAHYPRGWKLGPVSTATVQQLKDWLRAGDTQAPFKGQMLKAAADYKACPECGGQMWPGPKEGYDQGQRFRGSIQCWDCGHTRPGMRWRSDAQEKSAALRPVTEMLRRLRERRGECLECGQPNQEGKTCACVKNSSTPAPETV